MVKLPESSSPQDFDLHGAQRVREILTLHPFVSISGPMSDIQERLHKLFAYAPFHLDTPATHEEIESPLDKLERDPEYLAHFPGYQELLEEIEKAIAILALKQDPHIDQLLRSFMNNIVYVVIFWDSFMIAYKHKTTVTSLLGMGRNKVFFHLDRLGLEPRSFARVDSLFTLIGRSSTLMAMRKEIQDFLQEEEQG